MLSFEITDIARVFALSFLEIALSADNAVILGVLSRGLPVHLRQKALAIGILSALISRAALLFAVVYIFEYPIIQILGGLYLIYLSIRYFFRAPPETKKTHSFWKTVILIELIDIVFAIDSMVAGVAFIDANMSKIWIVYLGGLIGLIGIRFAANMFTNLIQRFPRLEMSAFLVVGLVGIKLQFSVFHVYFPQALFWILTIAFLSLGFTKRVPPI